MKINLRNLFKKPDRMIALDVELDGMHPSRIIQLSYLIIDGRRVRGKNMYFKAKAINRYARKVHGLGVYQLKKLSGGDIFACRADEIYNDFKDCKLVIGHDVAGDMRYLRAESLYGGSAHPDEAESEPAEAAEADGADGAFRPFAGADCRKVRALVRRRRSSARRALRRSRRLSVHAGGRRKGVIRNRTIRVHLTLLTD